MVDAEGEPQESRRRRRRRAPDPQPNRDGAARLEEVQSKFGDLVNELAKHHARRRDAAAVDNADVESAYRDLLHPRSRPLVVEILNELFGVVGGAALGYGLSIGIPEGGDSSSKWVVIFLGIGFLVSGIVLKLVRFR